jgi:lysophospholipase L1-like esterase
MPTEVRGVLEAGRSHNGGRLTENHRVPRPTPAVGALATVVLLGLVAAGCSDGSDRTAATTPAPAPTTTLAPPPLRYVSLGDSYSAGGGLARSVGPCGRTPAAYPTLVADRQGLIASFHACNGATTADVLEEEQTPGAGRQIDAVTADADVVSISIGGNDIGFRRVMTDCVVSAEPCTRLDDQVAADLAALGPRLVTVYRAIRQRAPRARLLVIGYPHLVVDPAAAPPEGCAGMTVDENRWVRRGGEAINTVVRDAALAVGALYVDAATAFAGHEACAPEPWMEGVTFSVLASFHPNAAGHEQLARLVGEELGDR